ncbi:MAG: 3D domain-containing protein [Acidobacteriota bacterium]
MINTANVLRYVIIVSILLVAVALPASTASAAVLEPVLTQGDQGRDIEHLQDSLNKAGYDPGFVDGVFGKQTLAAVARLQEHADILIDGVVGPQTRMVISNMNGINEKGSPTNSARLVEMVATAYDDSDECNYPFGGYPSFIGLPLKVGIVAVDPSFIPLGTRLYVEGYGEAIAADTGGAIKGNRIDLFYPTHQSASDFGIQNVKVHILD